MTSYIVDVRMTSLPVFSQTFGYPTSIFWHQFWAHTIQAELSTCQYLWSSNLLLGFCYSWRIHCRKICPFKCRGYSKYTHKTDALQLSDIEIEKVINSKHTWEKSSLVSHANISGNAANKSNWKREIWSIFKYKYEW